MTVEREEEQDGGAADTAIMDDRRLKGRGAIRILVVTSVVAGGSFRR